MVICDYTDYWIMSLVNVNVTESETIEYLIGISSDQFVPTN